MNSGVVSDNRCSNITKPDKIIKSCNELSCGPHWWAGPWQLCSSTCHKFGDPDPIRRRSVLCVDDNVALPDSNCFDSNKPDEIETCAVPLCNDTLDIISNDSNDMLEPENENLIDDNKKDKITVDNYSEITNIIE